jgi:two-component system, chemotaxis family, chemotaxis protein CheY
MKTLVIEDDLVSRLLLVELMARYGECHSVERGQKGLDAFMQARAEEKPFDLVCLDIMMPEMDGREVLKQIRDFEEAQGIRTVERVKVIMTTALADMKTIVESFNELCDAYLVKPIDKYKLLDHLKSLKLVE